MLYFIYHEIVYKNLQTRLNTMYFPVIYFFNFYCNTNSLHNCMIVCLFLFIDSGMKYILSTY